jgi:hypothetical protein
MHLETAFRWSTFLTLVCAALCLAFAEQMFLPGILTLAVPVVVLLAVAFVVEQRWTLTLRASNFLGLFIFAGAVLWIAQQLLQAGGSFVDVAPRSTVLLPYLGPVLMVLMLGIMFRTKRIHDFWWLHTVALLEVTLACVLASEPLFGVLLFVYLTCALWSLLLYYLHREQRRAAGRPAAIVPPGVFPRACRWALAVSALALMLFLLLPRSGESQWDPFTLSQNNLTTGFSDGINLNRSGQLHVSNRIAFEVYAEEADGSPKHNLSPDTRWRGSVLDQYDRGQWLSRSTEMVPVHVNNPLRQRLGSQPPLPDFGAGQFYLTFTVDTRRAHGLFLAEPVLHNPFGRWFAMPVISLDGDYWALDLFGRDADGSLLPLLPQPGKYRYKQVLYPPPEVDLGPRVHSEPIIENLYCRQPVAGIRQWTTEFIQQLRDQGRLAADDFMMAQDGTAWVDPPKRQKVARLFAGYLGLSDEFTYSLTIRRKHLNLDPTEDFLRHTRTGNCERFASALCLMLRSCGIPSRVVNGFRGAEAETADGAPTGRYVVRESHAHSWVEALVPRHREDGRWVYHWLTLDPKPGGDEVAASWSLVPSSWLELLRSSGALFQNFILEYNSERRGEAAEALTGKLSFGGSWKEALTRHRSGFAAGGAVVGLAALAWLSRGRLRLAKRQRAQPPAAPALALACYERLLVLLKDHCRLVPRPAQTPREFAGEAAGALRRQPAAAAFADVPARVVRLWYRFRYGHEAPAAAEAKDAERLLDELDALLQRIRHEPGQAPAG